MSDLVQQGKVRYIGSSTYPACDIVEAQWVSEKRGRERFVCEQPPYSILVRAIEAEVLPTCEKYGMGVIPWSPLAGGWLSGLFRKGQPVPKTNRTTMAPNRYDLANPEVQARLEAVEQGKTKFVPTTIVLSDVVGGHFTHLVETRNGTTTVAAYSDKQNWPIGAQG